MFRSKNYLMELIMTRKNEWDIVVVGGAYTDFMVRGSRLPKPGETVQGNVFMELPGGKGANQAVAAARLGGRVAMVTKVGSDQRGDTIVNSFVDEGVNTHYIVRDKSEPTGASLIQVEEKGQKQMLIWTGPTQRLSVQDVEVAADIIKTARVVMTQLEIALEATMATVRLASQVGVKIVLDPSPPVQ